MNNYRSPREIGALQKDHPVDGDLMLILVTLNPIGHASNG